MRTKRGWLWAVLAAMMAGSAASAQGPKTQTTPLAPAASPSVTATVLPLESRYVSTGTAPLGNVPPGQIVSKPAAPLNPFPFNGAATSSTLEGTPLGAPLQVADGYLAYEQPGCCGPLGRHGPIGTDIYFRTGIAIPGGPGTLAGTLNTGWRFDLGTRTLFFNTSGDSAWAVDLGLTYTFNNAGSQEIVPYFTIPATVRELHRWGFTLGLGHDWFVSGPGFVTWDSPSTMAYGVDFGGRWGTSSVQVNISDNPALDSLRNYDVTGSLFVGAHADYEVPMGGWTFLLGGRVEWSYTWTNLMPLTNSDIQDFSFLLTTGVRY
jgi:hypothetical protein